jgi:1-acyl-sn-glycerol-3-phosphate acyltransferase
MTRRPPPRSGGAGASNVEGRCTRIEAAADHQGPDYGRRANVLRLPSEGDGIYLVAASISSLVVRMTVRLRIYGAEHIPSHGAALLIANHVSQFDPVVISVVAHRLGRQVRLVTLQELFDKPALGSLVRALRWIPVSHGHGADVLARAQEALVQGDLVLIYPEGTIPAPAVIVPARRGAAVISVHAQVPVVPIVSSGLERYIRRRSWRRRQVIVRIGCPINHATLASVAADAGYEAASELLLAVVRSLARAHSKARLTAKTIDAHRRACTIFRQAADYNSEAWSMTNLGASLTAAKRFDEAIETSQHANAIFREVGDRSGEGATLANLGIALSGLGRLDEAVQALEQACKAFHEVGDRDREAGTLNSLGVALRALGCLDEGIEAHKRAHATFRRTGDRYAEASSLTELGIALKEANLLPEARRQWERAIRAFQQIGAHDDANQVRNMIAEAEAERRSPG